MVRFERNTSEKVEQAITTLTRAKRVNASYNTCEVLYALKEVFHGKCYICETRGIEAIEIEHLHPHKGNAELKYSWNNLYLSCRHCNNIKSDRYEPILDCCTQDVDKLIAFRKVGYFGVEERFTFTPATEFKPIEVDNTCKLLHDVYYGTTPQKQMEARTLRKRVHKEISNFKYHVRSYEEEDEGDLKEDERLWIIKELKNTSSFTAFKRWLIRDNIERYSEFREYV